MKMMLAFVAIVLLIVGASSCGGSALRKNQSAVLERSVKNDNDGDRDGGSDDVAWGRPAGATDAQVASALIKKYYTAAAVSNGAEACALTYLPVVKEIAQPEVRLRGAPTLPRLSCAAAMSKDLKQLHRHLVTQLAKLRVIGVRIKDGQGLVFVNFGAGPVRDVTIHRERGAWKVDGMLDTPLG